MIAWMQRYGLTLLRISLGIVFLWFGALKIFGVSPVVSIISRTYFFFPTDTFVMILGVWEAIIGLGLIFKIALRWTLGLLWLQMAGTFVALVLDPTLFFNGNVLLLTTEGEFVVKNLVLVTAAIVIGGSEVKPKL